MTHDAGTFVAILTVAVAFWVVPCGWRAIERITGRQPARYADPEDEDEGTRQIARALHPAFLTCSSEALWAELTALGALDDYESDQEQS